MAAERPRPGIRLTDAEREHAAARLHVAHQDGRLSLAELDERLAVVYRARVFGDLEPVLDDVPTDRERALLSDVGDDDVVRLHPGAGGVVGEGRWVVPRRMLIDNLNPVVYHWITVDLRTAVVRFPQVEIELRVGSPARLVLPPHGSADVSGLRGPGWPRLSGVPATPSPGGVHLVVRGVAARQSMVTVTYRRRRWWL